MDPVKVSELKVKGSVLIIVGALYGLKSSAKAWQIFFSNSLAEMGYTLCRADPDVFYEETMQCKQKQILVIHTSLC